MASTEKKSLINPEYINCSGEKQNIHFKRLGRFHFFLNKAFIFTTLQAGILPGYVLKVVMPHSMQTLREEKEISHAAGIF